MERIGDFEIVRIEGQVTARDAGPLCDLLVARVRFGQGKLIVEFADCVEMVRPAVRSLIVAATLLRATSGLFAVVASPELGGWLHRVSFVHLLPLYRAREDALAAMAAPPDFPATTETRTENCLTHPTSRTRLRVVTETLLARK